MPKELIVNKDICPQNHRCPCLRICSLNALEQKGYSAPTVNKDKCIFCGKCINYCPLGALQIKN